MACRSASLLVPTRPIVPGEGVFKNVYSFAAQQESRFVGAMLGLGETLTCVGDPFVIHERHVLIRVPLSLHRAIAFRVCDGHSNGP